MPKTAPLDPTQRRAEPDDRLRRPLSPAQQGLWLVEQLHPGSAAYHVPVAVELGGPLDVPALTRALQRVTDRQEALRTTVRDVAGRPFQHVEPHLEVSLSVTDLTGLPADARDAAVRDLVDAWAAEPFDLAAGPLIRARLIRLTRTDHVLVLVLHHMNCDGPSLHLLFDELTDLYSGAEPASLPTQYAEFAAMERDRALDPFNTYGAHTPAALIHDRLIGIENGPSDLTDVLADRYFRFMLEAVGMSLLRRWMIWAAVVFRTTRPVIA